MSAADLEGIETVTPSRWIHPNAWVADPPCERWPDMIPDGEEIQFHNGIRDWLEAKGWLYFYSNPSRRTGRLTGEPDFAIYGPCGRHWLVECKTDGTDLRPEQRSIKLHAAKMGHAVHVVRSWGEFFKAVGVNQ